jgi:hypothetical protein
MRRAALFFLLTLTIGVSACGSGTTGDNQGNNGNPVGPSGQPTTSTGTLAFSTTASKGWLSIDITVSGNYVGTLRRYFDPNPTASCVATPDARIVTVLGPGAHSYSARSNTDVTWSGTANVVSNGCAEVVLQCNNGDCSR